MECFVMLKKVLVLFSLTYSLSIHAAQLPLWFLSDPATQAAMLVMHNVQVSSSVDYEYKLDFILDPRSKAFYNGQYEEYPSYANNIYGVLSVELNSLYTGDVDVRVSFNNVAGDTGFIQYTSPSMTFTLNENPGVTQRLTWYQPDFYTADDCVYYGGSSCDNPTNSQIDIQPWGTVEDGFFFELNMGIIDFVDIGAGQTGVGVNLTKGVSDLMTIRVGDGEYYDYDYLMVGNSVPVPASAWFFGSALIGLAGIKRKK